VKICTLFLVAAMVSAYSQPVTDFDRAGSVPVPDPTVLTTQQLTKQIDSLKELLSQADQSMLDRLEALRLLHEERFNSIAQQFKERDTRTDQLATASTVAINAALQAAKEAVVNQNISNEKAIAKIEANTTKFLDNLDAKIIDLKEDIGALKNQGIGQVTQREAYQTDASFYVAALAVVVAIIGAGIAIMRP